MTQRPKYTKMRGAGGIKHSPQMIMYISLQVLITYVSSCIIQYQVVCSGGNYYIIITCTLPTLGKLKNNN